MRKVILLFVASFIGCFAMGQDNKSLLLPLQGNDVHAQPVNRAEMTRIHNAYLTKRATNVAAKTTGICCPITDWYDMWDQNWRVSVSTGYFFNCYPDSNVIDNSPGVITPYHITTHGMGKCFDPTDSSYFDFTANNYALVYPIGYPIFPGTSYSIDSFYTYVKYIRNNPDTTVVDSLVLEFALTQVDSFGIADSGVYNLKVNTADPIYQSECYDETPRWGTLHYNRLANAHSPVDNDCYFDSIFTVKQRYAIALTNANKNDTDLNGLFKICQTCPSHIAEMPIIPALNIPGDQREHLVTFVSFKSGIAYPNGTLASAANFIRLFAGEPNGDTTRWMQSSSNPLEGNPGSFEQGLIADNRVRYSDTGFTAATGHNTLIPAFTFPTVSRFDVPLQAFHIAWVFYELNITNANQSIANINAYPNPTANELSIAYSNKTLGGIVFVTLTNMVGQLVAAQQVSNGKAVFNTSALADGIYIYSLQGDGERYSGHAAIVH